MKYIRTFSQIDKDDLAFAGGKGANLGEMVKTKLPVPPGFIIGTPAYFDFLQIAGLKKYILDCLKTESNDPEKLLRVSKEIMAKFESIAIPGEIRQEIISAYRKIGNKKVAVRSSATAEDLPQASFAGQQSTFLNVKGRKELLAKVRSCWASLFTPRAIFYRNQNNFDHTKVGLAVIVQEMVASEVSGVMFTVDPVTEDKRHVVIEAAFGLGELVVAGKITPDQYIVDKLDKKILDKKIAVQKVQLVELRGENREISVSAKFQAAAKLSDSEIFSLADFGELIEKHYYFPQDIEWALEGKKIYILQTRPVTTLGKAEKIKSQDEARQTVFSNLKLILEGVGASPGITSGSTKILKSAAEIAKIKEGNVLVTEMTNPDFVPAMKKARAVVTDKGGRTSHAAIVSRELGIPAVVGTKNATKTLRQGQVVTVDGLRGKIYLGAPKIISKTLEIADKQPKHFAKIKTVTKIYLNLAEPEKADESSRLDVDGVGLLRAEFMIAQIGIHPKYAIEKGESKQFIDKLSAGLQVFAENFEPRPVIYRASDFKTNEYRNLTGGEAFEPEEENPMIGFRGAARYLAQPEVFQMELAALKKVHHKGFQNLKLMIPFVRTPEELVRVREIVEAAGLFKLSGFEFWMMIEVPSNVFLLPKFLDVGIDGVSIGSNDLTMLILGVDRDNELLADKFSEKNTAVLTAIETVVKTCRRLAVPCSICGQAPSVFDDLVQKLVCWGITSISVSPDSVDRIRELIYQTELDLVSGSRDFQGFKSLVPN